MEKNIEFLNSRKEVFPGDGNGRGRGTVHYAVVLGVGLIIFIAVGFAFSLTYLLMRRSSERIKIAADVSVAFERIVKNAGKYPLLASRSEDALKLAEDRDIFVDEYYFDDGKIKVGTLGTDKTGRIVLKTDPKTDEVLLENVRQYAAPRYGLHGAHPNTFKRPPINGFDQRYIIETEVSGGSRKASLPRIGLRRYIIRTWVPAVSFKIGGKASNE